MPIRTAFPRSARIQGVCVYIYDVYIYIYIYVHIHISVCTYWTWSKSLFPKRGKFLQGSVKEFSYTGMMEKQMQTTV